MMRILIFLFLLFSSCVCSAETIRLKSGKIVEGNIVEKTADHIKVDIGVGVNLTYYLDDIAKIEDVGEGKVKTDEVTLVITPLDRPAEPLPNVSSKDSGAVAFKKIMSFKDSLNTFVEDLKKSRIKQAFFQGKLKIAEKITDIDEIIISEEGTIPDGIVKEYDANNKLKSEVVFKGNYPQGPWKTYYPSGKLAAVINYENGKKNGEYKTFYESGQIETQGTFTAGKHEALNKKFDKNGRLVLETDYRNKNYDYISRLFKENGVRVEFCFKDGEVKLRSVYDIEGNLIKDQDKINEIFR